MIATCARCAKAFETTLEDANTPGVLCVTCYRAEHAANAPGLSPVYAAARQMLDTAAQDTAGNVNYARAWVGELHARITRHGNTWALWLDDATPIHPDTLALWAAAVGQDAAGWRVDLNTDGRIARLQWQTDGEPATEGGPVSWVGRGAP